MSWLRQDDYQAYREKASRVLDTSESAKWALHIWELTDASPEGRWFWDTSIAALTTPAKIRIILAPSAQPNQGTVTDAIELYRFLRIPSDFTTEYTRAVAHSFCHKTETASSCCAWFHFLCKSISVKLEAGQLPQVATQTPSFGRPPPTLPNADYGWFRSSFFIRRDTNDCVTLVCFAAMPSVRSRIGQFTESRLWDDVVVNPYILFDLVIEGLFFDVDKMVWNMNKIFGPMEHRMLESAHNRDYKKLNSDLSFAAIHNCAKHIAFLNEVLQSCIMAIDAAIVNVANASYPESQSIPQSRTVLVQQQLTETLRYRRTLFCATQLRLSSLQKRIDNVIALAFNLVTQQGSTAMMQDSRVMKAIAAITMIFLPTTGVATVLGSQLFVSEWKGDGSGWDVKTTPLFWITWWVSVPLTLCVIMLAAVWQWWLSGERRVRLAWRKKRRNAGDTEKKMP